ncbi:MAG: hypothetical protein PHQ34_10330 [Methanothrix sp.]|nr:hypothetical protein [Methanothrix sp.]
MSRICNILGLAVLGIALLVGAAAADGNVEVNGCVIPLHYVGMNNTQLVNAIDIGVISTTATKNPTGGSIGVVAGSTYDLKVASDTLDGILATKQGNHLTYPLNVSGQVPISGGATLVPIGPANTDCPEQVTQITYSQGISSDDLTGGDVGNYSINLTFTATEHF